MIVIIIIVVVITIVVTISLLLLLLYHYYLIIITKSLPRHPVTAKSFHVSIVHFSVLLSGTALVRDSIP